MLVAFRVAVSAYNAKAEAIHGVIQVLRFLQHNMCAASSLSGCELQFPDELRADFSAGKQCTPLSAAYFKASSSACPDKWRAGTRRSVDFQHFSRGPSSPCNPAV